MKESLDFFTIYNKRFSNERRIIIKPSKDIINGFDLSQADFDFFLSQGLEHHPVIVKPQQWFGLRLLVRRYRF